MDMDFGRVMGLMATRFGAREALVNTERGRRFTFREYHRLTNRIANMLTNRFGLGAGDRFMPIVENDNMALLHFPVFFKTRAAAAFTNYRDSMEEHLAQVDFLRPKVVFLERALIERYHRPLHERGVRMIAMDPGPGPDDVEDFWTLVNESSEEDPGIAIDVNHHVTLFRFTGGTTGRGKCVPYSVDNLLGLRDSFYIEPECGFD
ncbi:MAG: AMP-binding protein, partial [Proteobacteria bacterium]|nr:AMP-binding protein [Pseudomonadota bacterium]